MKNVDKFACLAVFGLALGSANICLATQDLIWAYTASLPPATCEITAPPGNTTGTLVWNGTTETYDTVDNLSVDISIFEQEEVLLSMDLEIAHASDISKNMTIDGVSRLQAVLSNATGNFRNGNFMPSLDTPARLAYIDTSAFTDVSSATLTVGGSFRPADADKDKHGKNEVYRLTITVTCTSR